MAEVNSTTVIKIAPNGSETRLQRYYRERVENLEAERAEIVKAVLDAAPSQEEVHKARWDLIVKQDELEELQRALGKANLYLVDQKKLMLVLKAENESLASENELQSRQINHLLSLLPTHSSPDDEVTFFQELPPGAHSSRKENHGPRRGQPSGRGVATASRRGRRPFSSGDGRQSNSRGKSFDAGSCPAGPSPASFQTQKLLEERIECQAQQIQSLQAKLHAMEALSAERAHVLESTSSYRVQENEVRCTQLKEVVADLERKLLASKAKIKDLTIHAIESKKDIDGRERRQIAENQSLRETNNKVVKQLKFERQLRKVHSSSQTGGSGPGNGLKVPDALRTAAEKRLPSAKVAFQEARRAQVKLQEKQRENRRMAVAFEEKMRENEKAVEHWKRKYHRLEQRRALEFKGWRTDVDLLRQQLLQLEAVWSSQQQLLQELQLEEVDSRAGGPNFARLRHNLMSPGGVKPHKFEREMNDVRTKLENMAEQYKVQLVQDHAAPVAAKGGCPYCGTGSARRGRET